MSLEPPVESAPKVPKNPQRDTSEEQFFFLRTIHYNGETYSRIGLLRSYGNLQSYWTTKKLWRLTAINLYKNSGTSFAKSKDFDAMGPQTRFVQTPEG